MAKVIEIQLDVEVPADHSWIKIAGKKYTIKGWDIDKHLFLLDEKLISGIIGFAYLDNVDNCNVIWVDENGNQYRQNRERIKKGNITKWTSLIEVEKGLELNTDPNSTLVYNIRYSRHVYGLYPEETTFFYGRLSTVVAILIPLYNIIAMVGIMLFGLFAQKSAEYRNSIFLCYVSIAIGLHLVLPIWIYIVGIFLLLIHNWTAFLTQMIIDKKS